MTKGFSCFYTITIGDINYGGHMGNERALVIFQDARLRLFRTFDVTEGNVGEGVGIIMVDSSVRYLGEVFLHDELQIHLSLQEMRGKKFTFSYSVTRPADDREVFSGTTGFLCFNYDSRKVVSIPKTFKERLHKQFGGTDL